MTWTPIRHGRSAPLRDGLFELALAVVSLVFSVSAMWVLV